MLGLLNLKSGSVLIDGEKPEKVKERVNSIRSNFQDVKYCFRD